MEPLYKVSNASTLLMRHVNNITGDRYFTFFTDTGLSTDADEVVHVGQDMVGNGVFYELFSQERLVDLHLKMLCTRPCDPEMFLSALGFYDLYLQPPQFLDLILDT